MGYLVSFRNLEISCVAAGFVKSLSLVAATKVRLRIGRSCVGTNEAGGR